MTATNASCPTVVIADDCAIFRSALKDFLSAHHLNVVGEASSGEQAVELTQTLAPDIAFVDLRMPGIGGLEACRRMRGVSCSVQLVLISASHRELPSQARGPGWTVLSKQELLWPGRVEALVDEMSAGPAGRPG